MTIIAFVNKKGGSGKTTLTCALGMYLAERAGKRVAIQDMEVNGGSSSFVEHAEHPNLVLYENGREYDYVIIDTQGSSDADELQEVEAFADFVIVPFRFTPLEIAKVQETEALLKHPEKARLLFTRVSVNTSAWRDHESYLSAFTLKPLKSYIRQLTAYEYFLVDGWKALGRDAIEELEALAWEVTTA